MREKFHELGPVDVLETTGMDVGRCRRSWSSRRPRTPSSNSRSRPTGRCRPGRGTPAGTPNTTSTSTGPSATRPSFEEGSRLAGGEWRPNGNVNERFGQWAAEEQDLRSPFAPHTRKGYERFLAHATSFGPHPVMTDGRDGEELTAGEVAVALGPLFPW